jgi:hypothetical protein
MLNRLTVRKMLPTPLRFPENERHNDSVAPVVSSLFDTPLSPLPESIKFSVNSVIAGEIFQIDGYLRVRCVGIKMRTECHMRSDSNRSYWRKRKGRNDHD